MKKLLPQIRLIYDRKHTATSTKKGLVQIELLYNRKRKYISTGIKLFPKEWSDKSRVVNHPLSLEYNTQIEWQMADIMRRLREMQENGYIDLNEVTAEGDNIQYTLIEYMQKCIDELSSESTKRNYLTVLNKLRIYGKFSTLQSVDVYKVMRFNQWMRNCGLKGSSRKAELHILSAVLNRAVNENLIDKNPMSNFKFDRVEPAKRKYLTEEQLRQIEEYVPKKKYESDAIDVFLFQCYTGMSYTDVNALTPDSVIVTNGNYYIRTNRVKTSVEYKIKLLPTPLKIWLKHNGKLPIRTAPLYNRHLNLIEKRIGLTQHITTHVARHTFATLALSKGVRIEVVSKMLGHTNIKTTQIYAKILAKDVEDGFDILAEKLDK